MDPQDKTSLTEEEMWKIEDELMGVEKGTGGGKGIYKGPKTSRKMKETFRENAQEKRKEEAADKLKRELRYFPFESGGKEKIDEVVQDYSEWILKSLKDGEPHLSNLDEELKYSQSKSSGPGGQNVNKTSNAVTVKHLMTGIFSRSEDSRETLVNKRTAFSKLYENLTNHVKKWETYLADVSEDKKQEEIESFVKNLSEEKLN
jgi:hypothetical protein